MNSRTSPVHQDHVEEVVSTLFSFIEAQGHADYIGEAVSQLEHSLQAAHLAEHSGADRDTILGALLHDIGRFIPDADSMPAIIAPNGVYVGREAHEIVGEKYLRDLGFNEKICQLVGAHVAAKRYLTAVDPEYYDGLSNSSKTTLKYQVSRPILGMGHADSHQGGPYNAEQVREAEKDPWLAQKLAVRKWDDMAKDPELKTQPLSHYRGMAVESLREQMMGTS